MFGFSKKLCFWQGFCWSKYTYYAGHPQTQLTFTHIQNTHGGGSFHEQVTVSFAVSSVLQAWMSSDTDFSFLGMDLAKGAVLSGPSRHGAIQAVQSPGTALD